MPDKRGNLAITIRLEQRTLETAEVTVIMDPDAWHKTAEELAHEIALAQGLYRVTEIGKPSAQIITRQWSQLPITEAPLSFDRWMIQVDKHLRSLSGLVSEDIGDSSYRDNYEAGTTPQDMARIALRDSDFPTEG
jgi:hypothetical protein